MKLTLTIAALCSALLCSSCSPDPDTAMGISTPVATNARVQVTRIGILGDSIAYNGVRGIYIITDTKTGQEYIGISGVGISELGAHSTGKTTVSDER